MLNLAFLYKFFYKNINRTQVVIKTKLDEDKSETKDDSDSVIKDEKPNRGTELIGATACPQDITYPTDLNLLNDVAFQLFLITNGKSLKCSFGKISRLR